MKNNLQALQNEILSMDTLRPVGRISALSGNKVVVEGLTQKAGLGDLVQLVRQENKMQLGEIVALTPENAIVMPDGPLQSLTIGGLVKLLGQPTLAPDNRWLGRVIGPYGEPLDKKILPQGPVTRSVLSQAPDAVLRRPLGQRLETGMKAFNTLLPIVQGQRVGLFAGSGVGKSSLLAKFARHVQADVCVIALIGERGREVREFVDHTLGPEGMQRSVVVASTSDQSALLRRRAAWTAMTVAEHFRDQGLHVLMLVDSITRFAEAHREVAATGGEAANFKGYPASVIQTLMALAERAGPGTDEMGDITSVFSVLVSGSDMEEPIADIMRGTLDGHVVLNRNIAERGRFPAVDLLRSVSRSLPQAASPEENALIHKARGMLGTYDRAELMIQAGLYTAGSNAEIDEAISIWPKLDHFLSMDEPNVTSDSFRDLAASLSDDPEAEILPPEKASGVR